METLFRSQRGQASVEWIALVGLVTLLFGGLIAAGVRPPGTAIAESISKKIRCAANLGGGCGGPGELTIAYGSELGALVEEHAPLVGYEPRMRSLPVDFRECSELGCSEGRETGRAAFSDAGEPVTAFTRVVDCRPSGDQAGEEGCAGEAAGSLYLQYWFYYPDSYTTPYPKEDLGPLPGSFHQHDWESFQVRIGPDGEVSERASAHHGYDHSGTGLQGQLNQAGKVPVVGVPLPKSSGWGEERGTLWVSDDSHAGRVVPRHFVRATPRRKLWLTPLEEIAAAEGDGYDFGEITPPWRKSVWTEPESKDT